MWPPFYQIQVQSLSTRVSNWLTDWLTDSPTSDELDDVTFEDANSKLLDVVSVAVVDAEEDFKAEVW